MKKMMERNVLALMCVLASATTWSQGAGAAGLTIDINTLPSIMDNSESGEATPSTRENSGCGLPSEAAGTRVKTTAQFVEAVKNAKNNGLSDTIIVERQDDFYIGNTLVLDTPLIFNDTDKQDLTIISEDPCVPADYIIEGIPGQRSLFISNASEGAKVTIKGFTFSGGGAGLYVDNYSLNVDSTIFRDISFSDNEGGAAIEALNGTVNLNAVQVLNTIATDIESVAAVLIKGSGSTFIKNGLFEGNSGISLSVSNSGLTVESSEFRAGTSHVGRGTVYSKPSISVRDSVFDSNTTTEPLSAVIYSEGSIELSNSEFKSNTSPRVTSAEHSIEVLNSLFDDNSSNTVEGAVLWSNGSAAGYQILVQNSVFKSNKTGDLDVEGTSAISCNSKCKVVNSYFSGNKLLSLVVASRDGAADDNILLNNIFDLPDPALANRYVVTSNAAKVSVYNNVFKSNQAQLINVPEDKLFQTDNISVIDLLLDSNLVPQDGSPVIDAGLRIDALLPETDYLQNARLVGATIDIGPAEYGVSGTKPQIRTFKEKDGSTSKVIDFIELEIEFVISENSTLVDVLFDDGSGAFTSIMPDTVSTRSFIHKIAFDSPGNKTLRLKVVDSRGEEDLETEVISITDKSTLEVVESIRNTCVTDPDNCALDLTVIQKLYEDRCKNDPESCNVDVNTIQVNAKKECQNNPASCSIPSEFDKNNIPTPQGNWILMGASAAMSESELKINFNTVDVVWAYVDGQWKAYSGNEETAAFLQAEGVPVLTELPEYSGFWLRK